MNIATNNDMLMTIHLPHNNKIEGMRRIENIILNSYKEDNNNNGFIKYKREKICSIIMLKKQ